MLGLVNDAEEALVREVARILGRSLSVVRTREEFEALAPDRDLLVIGNDQTQAERISTLRRARRRQPSCVIAAIADHTSMKVDLLEVGASLVVSTEDTPERLARGIRTALENGVDLQPEEAAAVVRRLQHLSQLCVDQGVDVDRCEQLTRREREIIALLAQRKSNGEVARELGIAVGTVKTHVHNILDKLDVEDRGLAGVYWRVFAEKRGLRR